MLVCLRPLHPTRSFGRSQNKKQQKWPTSTNGLLYTLRGPGEHSARYKYRGAANRARRGTQTTADIANRSFFAAACCLALSLALELGPALPASGISSNNLLFLEAWRAVDKAYVDKTFNGVTWFKYREDTVKRTPMDSTEQTYDAIRKMLAKLDDPFTRFLEPEKYASLTDSTMSANVTGVGIEMAYLKDDIGNEIPVIVSPVPGGPADMGGVLPMDTIVAVDGSSVKGFSLYEVADVLQGPPNSKVVLTLERATGMNQENILGTTKINVTLVRQTYLIVPVQAKLCEPAPGTVRRIFYIRLSTFNLISGEKVKEALQLGLREGADAYVLDLRSNSGGLFPGALEIAKYFMNNGTIVYISDSDGVRDVFEANGTALVPDSPLTILVDKGTASASEVLAGALHDNGRARVLGETTFGKGLIQTVVPLSDGSAVSVTVARYQTPSGASINKVGIKPDGPLPSASSDANIGSSVELPGTSEAFCSIVSSNPELYAKLFS